MTKIDSVLPGIRKGDACDWCSRICPDDGSDWHAIECPVRQLAIMLKEATGGTSPLWAGAPGGHLDVHELPGSFMVIDRGDEPVSDV